MKELQGDEYQGYSEAVQGKSDDDWQVVSVGMKPELIERIDHAADEISVSRSKFIRRVLKEYLKLELEER